MGRITSKTVTLVRPGAEEGQTRTLTFVLNSLPGWTQLRLNKNLVAIFGTALAGMEGGLSLGGKFNIGKAAEAISRTLGELDDDKYIDLFTQLFSTTVWLPTGTDAAELSTGAAPVSLKDPEILDMAFDRDLEGLYRLAVMVMEHNRFPFFARVVKAGRAILTTLTSSATTKSAKKPRKRSGTSEP